MSITAINWALNVETGSPTAKLVLIKLADNADDDGVCFPSQTTIARHCELSTDSVSRHVKKLETLGLISVRRERVNGVKQRNIYTLNLRDGYPQNAARVPAESREGTRRESKRVPAESRSNLPDITTIEPKESTPPRSAGASRLDQNFHPPNDWIDFALTEGFSQTEAQREADKFRDYWIAQPGAKGRKLDWFATWRNWVRRAGDGRKPSSSGQRGYHGPADPVEIGSEIIRQLEGKVAVS